MKKPLLAHQKASLKFMAPRERVFDMSDPGTMKTRVEIEDFVRNRDKGDQLIVIAPKSILYNAWGSDLDEFAPDLVYSIAQAENRFEALAKPADVYIVNTDGVKALLKASKEFWKRKVRIAVDESSMFKHHTSGRSRALNAIKKHFPIRRNMTGSPNSNTITDIWNQAYFLDDGKRLGDNFYAFRNATCVPEQVGRKAEMVKWVDKPGAEEAVAGLLADITIRHRFEDCIDIPETFTHSVRYKLPKKQMGAYDSMREDSIAVMKKGYVSAINKAAMRTKILQIA